MIIRTAKFITSYSSIEQMKAKTLPQFAFIGRSNVGKSSLINTLCNRKDLAKTSGKPGKTRLINEFSIDESFLFIDLPGYGFAQVSKKMRSKFSDMIQDYVTQNSNLYCLFVLIDGSIPPQAIDLEFINWAGQKEVPIAIVFTKQDKAKPSQYEKNIENFNHNLYQYWEDLPQQFVVSSKKRKGLEELMYFVKTTLEP